LTDVKTGKTYPLRPGTIYVLDEHERHCMTVQEEMSIVCIFVPALVGTETHDADGSYPLLEG
jgi:L-ectoine synthase